MDVSSSKIYYLYCSSITAYNIAVIIVLQYYYSTVIKIIIFNTLVVL